MIDGSVRNDCRMRLFVQPTPHRYLCAAVVRDHGITGSRYFGSVRAVFLSVCLYCTRGDLFENRRRRMTDSAYPALSPLVCTLHTGSCCIAQRWLQKAVS